MPPNAIMFWPHRDEPVERRADAQVVDVALGHLDRHLRLVALLARARRWMPPRSGRVALHVGFELRQPLPRFVEEQQVLLAP